MTTYELHYFNAAARADLSRLLLDFAGASYKNVLVKGVEWGTKQDTTPFGKIPVLVIKDADGSTKVGTYRAIQSVRALPASDAYRRSWPKHPRSKRTSLKYLVSCL
ncbi:hypothetical protein EXIGLDRAFT_692165 [Exidia glandulosa HHB12029]|uniref:GST N-terminal domain-containing protein n=1 Tax=Exidia glandulosa HHB12029 TaxID=1314781 RepID=A0A165I5D8_EXIGL|nr:hypothetical protein EXIGLDRAFT_692165 [Exidia glandulosa HHB12029]